MSIQLEVVKFRDLVPLQSVPRFVEAFGAENPAIEITGEDFRSVDKVLINEIPSPEFIIISKHKIFAQLPQNTNKISTISIVSGKFTRSTRSSKLDYELGDKTRTVEGLQKLMQLFVKWLLQSPGSDIFNPERGGGLQELVGVISTNRSMGPVLATVTRAVQNTVTQIRTAQARFPQLPLNERLLNAEVIDLDVFEAQMTARLRVSLQSIAGPRAAAEIGL
jgi:hypothetical protein